MRPHIEIYTKNIIDEFWTGKGGIYERTTPLMAPFPPSLPGRGERAEIALSIWRFVSRLSDLVDGSLDNRGSDVFTRH